MLTIEEKRSPDPDWPAPFESVRSLIGAAMRNEFLFLQNFNERHVSVCLAALFSGTSKTRTFL
ncbi:MAG: hypothetical protein ACREV5_23135, partial [Steroidobacter sp.]